MVLVPWGMVVSGRAMSFKTTVRRAMSFKTTVRRADMVFFERTVICFTLLVDENSRGDDTSSGCYIF